MKRILILFLFISVFFSYAQGQQVSGDILNFDEGWRFYRGGMQGAEQPAFNDAGWRKVELPHDYSIEDRPGTRSPFDPAAISQISGGFTTGGTAWYRKTFKLPLSTRKKRILIRFDGVYMNATVYVNGQYINTHPYGYTSFSYDITKSLQPGASNLIAVEVKNEGQNSRWYAGSGIYRHVWLETVNELHIGPQFITSPVADSHLAHVILKTLLVNKSNINASMHLVTRFKTPAGLLAGKAEQSLELAAGKEIEIVQELKIPDPQLWSCDAPALYQAVTDLYKGDSLISTRITFTGIRTISFDAVNGFKLNGKSLKLRGGCIHHDNGMLGARAYDRAEERKVELLKANGFNAIRCSHNPPSPAFLDACDRLGMLVMDEAFDMWNLGKNPYDYHLYFGDWARRDIESMVLRDRNHPSIIIWSIGNEIPEKADASGAATAILLKGYIKALDSTRPVTSAVNDLRPDKDTFFSILDVAGYNYAAGGDHLQPDLYASDHLRLPGRIMLGTESYPQEAFASWMSVLDHPYVLGDFVWTAWDYLGEAGIGWIGYPQYGNSFPWNLAFTGDLDICGWKRPQSYYRDALWKEGQLSVFVVPPKPSFKSNPIKSSWAKWDWADVVAEWNWKGYENKPLEVVVYSSLDSVELFLNNRSLGKREVNRSTRYMAAWKVAYEAGELKAIGYKSGHKAAVSVLQTAGTPVSIRLKADRSLLHAGIQDLSYITAELVDARGVRNPGAELPVTFSLTGDAELVGIGNANPLSLESYQQSSRKTWKGRCLLVIKAGKKPGKIILTARVPGVRTAAITLAIAGN